MPDFTKADERKTDFAAIDKGLLQTLNDELDVVITTLELKGTGQFADCPEAAALKAKVVKLVSDLQFYRVLPKQFHVAHGGMIRHLPD